MARLKAPNLVDTIKEIAINANQSSKPCNWVYGTVVSTAPLKIRIQSTIILTESFLVLSNAVKDHEVDITVSMKTVDDNYLDENAKNHTHGGSTLTGNMGAAIAGNTDVTNDFDTTHHHDIKGCKKIIVHNALKVGEKVILLQMAGGKQYFVLDRVTPHITSGEWL